MKTGFALLLLLFLALSGFVDPVLSSDESVGLKEIVAENTWVIKAPMPTPRSGLGVAAVDGKIFAIGGDGLGTNEMYEPATDKWTTREAMPTPRAGFGIAVYENKIYCMGGFGFNVTEVYDPATDTWETRASMPRVRWWVGANVAGGKIYVMGGEPNQTLNDCYDPAADSWTAKAPIPNVETEGFNVAAIYAASAAVDDKIYWIGVTGFYYSPLGYKLLNQMYNPENDSWSLRKSPPSHVRPRAAGVTSGVWAPTRIHVIGTERTNVAYDPVADTWVHGENLSPSRVEFGVAVVNDKLYVIGGGYLVSNSAVNEQYTPFDWGTVAPVVSVLSPQNATYRVSDSLVLELNKQVVWVGCSFDGEENVTLKGNVTLSGLTWGQHNVTVYARDMFGNVGASETVCFTVAGEADPLPTVLLGVAVATVTAGVVGVRVYLGKRKKSSVQSARGCS